MAHNARFVVMIGLAAVSVGFCRLATLAVPPTKDDIAKAIKQLGDDIFTTRQMASEFLWQAGRAAEDQVRQAAMSDDIEVARRAREILEKFKFGIYPDTPERIRKLVGEYRSGVAERRDPAIKDLLKQGKPGIEVLLKLAAAEDDPETRKTLSERIGAEASQVAGHLLAEGDAGGAEELLDMAMNTVPAVAVRHYVAYQLLRGKVEVKIQELLPRADKDKRHYETLVYLYRAQGDLKTAHQMAVKAGKAGLPEFVLIEMGDWKTLGQSVVGKPNQEETPFGTITHGLKATYHRLAGNLKEAKAELDQGLADDEWSTPYVLMFNDQPREGIDLLIKKQRLTSAFEFLTFQLRFKEALELADKAQEGPKEELFALKLLKAKTLQLLGETDKAKDLFVKVAEELNENQGPQFTTLVEAEYQAGLKDLAFEHCAKALAKVKGEGNVGYLLGKVFPKAWSPAEIWWQVFRKKYPKEDHLTSLKRLRDFLGQDIPTQEFMNLIKEAEQIAKGLSVAARETWLEALAKTCRAGDKDDLALGFLEKAANVSGSATGWIAVGDFLLEKKRWRQAAQVYAQAWDKDRKQPAPLFLQGYALAQAGEEREGKLLMERARMLPLAGDATRYNLAETLSKNGLKKNADQEQEFLRLTGEFQSVYVTNAFNKAGESAVAGKEFDKAAVASERTLLTVLQSGMTFMNNRAYLFVPFSAHKYRARAHLAAGRIADAGREANLAFDLLPGDIDLAIQMLPDFDHRDAGGKEAEALFQRAFAIHEKLCADFPNSAWCRNNLAWLTARCRRRLDDGLRHSQKAVELSAGNAGHLDTLAEVHFQRGDKDKAIAFMKKCIELEPKTEYFAKQLKRFEAGDPKTEPPSEH